MTRVTHDGFLQGDGTRAQPLCSWACGQLPTQLIWPAYSEWGMDRTKFAKKTLSKQSGLAP